MGDLLIRPVVKNQVATILTARHVELREVDRVGLALVAWGNAVWKDNGPHRLLATSRARPGERTPVRATFQRTRK
jgi:hypothetical protein